MKIDKQQRKEKIDSMRKKTALKSKRKKMWKELSIGDKHG